VNVERADIDEANVYVCKTESERTDASNNNSDVDIEEPMRKYRRSDKAVPMKVYVRHDIAPPKRIADLAP
jgi:hypothetical protein